MLGPVTPFKTEITKDVYPVKMSDTPKLQGESPFACVMDAIDPGKRESHLDTAKYLFSRVAEIREMPNGYAFRLSNDSDVLLKLAAFIDLERVCCPFFGFNIEVEPEGGPVWLKLTGREGVKPFIRAEIGEFLNKESAF